MDVQKNIDIESKLFRLNPFKRERMLIRVHSLQGLTIDSKIISGSKTGVSSTEEIILIIRNLLEKCHNEQLILKEIEIIHTHTTHTLANGNLRFGELSNTDIKTALYLKTLFNTPIRMKVLSEIGISVSEVF